MALLFRKTRLLESKMDEFLDITSQASLVLSAGVRAYLEDAQDEFLRRVEQVAKLESRADKLRREIESQLYTDTLLPESRGDVLGLLEHTDRIINQSKSTLKQFDIELPEIPVEAQPHFIKLTEQAVLAVEELVKAIRAFIRDPMAVNNFVHKVYFFEREADSVADTLLREVFRSNLELSHKNHLRSIAKQIDGLADKAEDVADRLAIFNIKRSV